MRSKLPFLLVVVTVLLTCGVGDVRAIGARPRGMGGAFIAISDDENAVWTNPAGMSQIDRSAAQVSAQVVDRNKFMNDSASFVGKIYQAGGRRKVTLEDYLESDYEFRSEPERMSNYSWGAGFRRMRRSADLNEEMGREYISERQDSLTLGFSTRFPIAERLTRRPEMYAGLSIRYLKHDWRNPSLEGSLNSRDVYDLNLSAFYRATHRLNVGGVVESVVSETYATHPGTVRNNSTALNLGAAYTFGERRDTTVALDVVNVFDAQRARGQHVRLGMERQFLDNDLALRIGARDGTLTLGFGLKFFEDFRMDYAYENYTDFREHHVSLRMPF